MSSARHGKSKDKHGESKKKSAKKDDTTKKVTSAPNTAIAPSATIPLATRALIDMSGENLDKYFPGTFLTQPYKSITESVTKLKQCEALVDAALNCEAVTEKTKGMLKAVRDMALAAEGKTCISLLKQCDELSERLGYSKQNLDQCRNEISVLPPLRSDQHACVAHLDVLFEHVKVNGDGIANFRSTVRETEQLIAKINENIGICLAKPSTQQPSAVAAMANTGSPVHAARPPQPPVQQKGLTTGPEMKH